MDEAIAPTLRFQRPIGDLTDEEIDQRAAHFKEGLLLMRDQQRAQKELIEKQQAEAKALADKLAPPPPPPPSPAPAETPAA